MNVASWRATVKDPAFALAELSIVVVSGVALCLAPQIGAWAIVVALIPCGFRFSVGEGLFRRTQLDALLATYLLFAAIGSWTAYDASGALHKFLAIVAGVILYYVLSSQPRRNRIWVAGLFFSGGIVAALYFFLTYDFITYPRKIELVNQIGRLIVLARPELGWRAIHPNYIAGISAIASLFGFYLLLHPEKKLRPFSLTTRLISLGLLILLSTIVMATSRGVLMAIAVLVLVWLLWIGVKFSASKFNPIKVSLFPAVVMTFLAAVVFFLYAGPARSGESVSGSNYFGNGSRAELFERSLYLVPEFPVIGAGLESFPGLYSHYLLGIPNYNVPNSHNLFLDVFIELGMVGGIAFLLMYLLSIWRISQSITIANTLDDKLLHWVVFGALILAFVHGIVDDYLFQGSGAILSVALLGVLPGSSRQTSIYQGAIHRNGTDMILLVVAGVAMLALILIYHNAIRSVWFSNFGAVQMAKVELAGFPTNQWAEADIVEKLQDAETSFLASVEADPSNRTANHRLGLISMLRRDFTSGCAYLEAARKQSPDHRGIVKSLGYCYVWLGENGKARPYLTQIPEARSELDIFVWWWGTQGRNDLAEKATLALDLLGYSK
ncbi:MAG: O-antigen ligase family protein [Chloroflexota bacterium]